MIYFAYGSNMDTTEMTRPKKCPCAVFKGTLYVLNRKLVFKKKSMCNKGDKYQTKFR